MLDPRGLGRRHAGVLTCLRIESDGYQREESGAVGTDTTASAELYRRLVPSVVVIRGYDEGGRVDQGSEVVAFDGTVVTNQHVVEGATDLFVGVTGGENRPDRGPSPAWRTPFCPGAVSRIWRQRRSTSAAI